MRRPNPAKPAKLEPTEKTDSPQRRKDAEESAEKTNHEKRPNSTSSVELVPASLRLSLRLCVSAGNRLLPSPTLLQLIWAAARACVSAGNLSLRIERLSP
jgi:hypothetical protein